MTTQRTAEPVWVPAETVKQLHDADAEAAGAAAVSDMSTVDAALNAVRQRWLLDGERDVVRLGVAHLTELMRHRPFGARNAATGLAALVVFVEANGYRWAVPDGPVLAAYVRAYQRGRYTEEGLAETLRPDIVPA